MRERIRSLAVQVEETRPQWPSSRQTNFVHRGSSASPREGIMNLRKSFCCSLVAQVTCRFCHEAESALSVPEWLGMGSFWADSDRSFLFSPTPAPEKTSLYLVFLASASLSLSLFLLPHSAKFPQLRTALDVHLDTFAITLRSGRKRVWVRPRSESLLIS